eukprot:1354296-Pleurochrysis_carterae.AAC.1
MCARASTGDGADGCDARSSPTQGQRSALFNFVRRAPARGPPAADRPLANQARRKDRLASFR